MEKKKNILVAVSGGIAVYKVCDLVSKLSRENVEIKVVMTEHAMKFVPPVTFEALSHNAVASSMFDDPLKDPIPHITLAKWADLVIVAPATANIIAKITAGIADDLLTSTLLACTCPVILCPAMNTNMLENPVTQRNLRTAADLGFHILDPDFGRLACIDEGKGRLPSTETMKKAIFEVLSGETEAKSAVNNIPAEDHSSEPDPFSASQAVYVPDASVFEGIDEDEVEEENPLKGFKVLISAGPTQESIDPVRFVSNHSSGKQGYAIAEAARNLGADVTLVSGPVSLNPPGGVKVLPAVTALDMEKLLLEEAPDADFVIMAAAVADYRPKTEAEQKIKKNDDSLVIEFVKNPDILKQLGTQKPEDQVICGFAMETQDLDRNARSKLESKNCDLLIANNLRTEGAGFQNDTNIVSLLLPEKTLHLPKMSKSDLGYTILAQMLELWKGKK